VGHAWRTPCPSPVRPWPCPPATRALSSMLFALSHLLLLLRRHDMAHTRLYLSAAQCTCRHPSSTIVACLHVSSAGLRTHARPPARDCLLVLLHPLLYCVVWPAVQSCSAIYSFAWTCTKCIAHECYDFRRGSLFSLGGRSIRRSVILRPRRRRWGLGGSRLNG